MNRSLPREGRKGIPGRRNRGKREALSDILGFAGSLMWLELACSLGPDRPAPVVMVAGGGGGGVSGA